LLRARWGERDAPEIRRACADAVLDHFEPTGGVELGRPTRRDSDRTVALAIRLERRERQVGCLRAAAPARPVDGERDRLLSLGTAFDDGADGHVSREYRANGRACRGV